MYKTSKIAASIAAVGLAAGAAGTAHAIPSYGDLATPPGYYAGNGPTNGKFTIDTSNGIEVGLRAKDRETVTPIDGPTGLYLARPGICPVGPPFCFGAPKALWNYEFSVNTLNGSLGSDLSNYRVELRIDRDPSLGISFVTILDAYSNWGDNEYVDGPAYAGKRVAVGANPADDLPLAGEDGVQQSANPLFANSGFGALNPSPFPFDPFAPGLYEIEISVYAAADTAGVTELAGTDITVQVVPEPASALLVGLGLAGLGFIRRRKVVA